MGYIQYNVRLIVRYVSSCVLGGVVGVGGEQCNFYCAVLSF